MRNIIYIILRLCSRHKHTFDEWFDIFNRATPGSKLRKNALKGMERTADTRKQWDIVCSKAETGSKIEDTAFRWLDKLDEQ